MGLPGAPKTHICNWKLSLGLQVCATCSSRSRDFVTMLQPLWASLWKGPGFSCLEGRRWAFKRGLTFLVGHFGDQVIRSLLSPRPQKSRAFMYLKSLLVSLGNWPVKLPKLVVFWCFEHHQLCALAQNEVLSGVSGKDLTFEDTILNSRPISMAEAWWQLLVFGFPIPELLH